MNERIMMKTGPKWPPFPNGGELYLVKHGDFKETAYFHVDRSNNNNPWWESVTGETLEGVTHWDYLPDRFE